MDILASATYTAADAGTAHTAATIRRSLRNTSGLNLIMEVTADTGLATDLLDVKVQASVCGDWIDVAYFQQHQLDDGAAIYATRISRDTALAPLKNVALVATNSRNIFSDIDSYRAHTTLFDAGAGVSVTFSVKGFWD